MAPEGWVGDGNSTYSAPPVYQEVSDFFPFVLNLQKKKTLQKYYTGDITTYCIKDIIELKKTSP